MTRPADVAAAMRDQYRSAGFRDYRLAVARAHARNAALDVSRFTSCRDSVECQRAAEKALASTDAATIFAESRRAVALWQRVKALAEADA